MNNHVTDLSEFHIDENHFRVAIFGSARIQPDDERYQLIYSLSQLIANEGMDIVTGGGPGIMEAANKGHQEGRNGNDHLHSFGLTIRLPKEQMNNVHLDVKKDFDHFSGRLDTFMQLSNVVVVAPGGVGTMLEFFYTWQLVQVKHICNTPIILLGNMWPELIEWIEKWPVKNQFISPDDLNPLFLANDCEEAIKVIRMAHEEFKKGGADFCLNYKKYRLQ
ncbi:LOG family protein [Candidatus Peregrinibacteria bacterium]|nr:MAG: LOG family protein [Candidatus Peregrinibacteria bacterium]